MSTYIRLLLPILLAIAVVAFLVNRYQLAQKTKMEPFDEEEDAEFERQQPAGDRQQQHSDSLSKAELLDSLEKLGYFSFTARKHLAAVKEAIAEGYESQRFLTSELDEETLIGQCGRYYFCDTESLFEIGGLEEYLLQVKPIFDKLGIPLKWSDEYWSDDITLHTIVLNGKQYDAFRGNPNDTKIWAFALKNFAEMLNDQLALHGSDEKIYLMGGGNDATFYILTDKQFAFVRKYFTSDEVPRTVAEWWKRGG